MFKYLMFLIFFSFSISQECTNGRYEQEMPVITRTLDKMPVIDTDKPSNFSVEGEFAQILPNPNPINNNATGDPNGVAFIDDFEGSKRTTSIPILRRFWRATERRFEELYFTEYVDLGVLFRRDSRTSLCGNTLSNCLPSDEDVTFSTLDTFR